MASKVVRYFRVLSFSDFLRKTSDFIVQKYYFIRSVTRYLKSYIYFRRIDVKIGEGVRITGQNINTKIGDNFELYDRCVIEIGASALLKVGDNCLFSYGVILQCSEKVEIGNSVQIGEYTSIRDTTHSYSSLEIPMKAQRDFSEKITIENDVWVGRGCIILPGTHVGNGVIIGANSVVKGNLENFGIYAGSPAKLIKKRIPFTV